MTETLSPDRTVTAADVLPDVRKALRGVLADLPDNDPQVVAACEMLAALYNAEQHGAADDETQRAHAAGLMTMRLPDARAFDGARGGGIPDGSFSAVPSDPMGAHTVKRGRNRKGATSKVIGRGDAPVIGRLHCDVNGAPLLAAPSLVADVAAWSWCAARVLVTDAARDASDPLALRRHRSGWSGIGVARLTDLCAALDPEFPRLLGSEGGQAWSQVVPGDRSSRSSVAVQRTDIGDGASPTLAAFAAPAGGYAAHTSKLDWPTRLRITTRRRASDPGAFKVRQGTGHVHAVDRGTRVLATGDVTVGRTVTRTIATDVPAWETFRVFALVGAAADTVTRFEVRDPRERGGVRVVVRTAPAVRVHVGRTTVPRQTAKTARTVKAARQASAQRVAARTIGTVTAPDTAQGWQMLAESMNRGERVIATSDAGTVTITRGKRSGVWSATDKRAGLRFQARTAQSLGIRLATA